MGVAQAGTMKFSPMCMCYTKRLQKDICNSVLTDSVYNEVNIPYSLKDIPLSRALFLTCPMASSKVANKQNTVLLFCITRMTVQLLEYE